VSHEPSAGESTLDPLTSRDPELLVLEVLELRDLLRGAEAKIGELQTRIARLDAQRSHSAELWAHRMDHTDRQLAAAEQRVAMLESSTSWRIGQFVLRPLALWRRIAG
jgi:hypothetical protein